MSLHELITTIQQLQHYNQHLTELHYKICKQKDNNEHNIFEPIAFPLHCLQFIHVLHLQTLELIFVFLNATQQTTNHSTCIVTNRRIKPTEVVTPIPSIHATKEPSPSVKLCPSNSLNNPFTTIAFLNSPSLHALQTQAALLGITIKLHNGYMDQPVGAFYFVFKLQLLY